MKPNVLLLVADQLRFDCLGYAKRYPVLTPNIDKLARQCVVFNKAYTPIPVCGPARSALLCGRRAEEYGAYWNNGIMRVQTLRPNLYYSWLTDFKDNGYNSGHFGKWSVNSVYNPSDFGYDISYDASEKSKQVSDLFKQNGFFGTIDNGSYQDSLTNYEAQKTIELMRKLCKKDEPWIVHSEFAEPHLPCTPTQEFLDLYKDCVIPEWDNFYDDFANKPYVQKQQLYSWGLEDFEWKDWEPVVRRYYAIISQLDAAIGEILHALDELGQADNTIVVLTADHGDMCGAHRMIDKHYVLYDDIVRVPLLIRCPSKFVSVGVDANADIQPQTGETISKTIDDDYVCNMLDVAATLADINGSYEGNEHVFHGCSLMPHLRGEDYPHRDFAVSTFNGQQFGLYSARMIRTDEWKYIWNGTDIDELYNMQDDPNEMRNMIYQCDKEIVADLRRRLYHTLSQQCDGLMSGSWLQRQLLENKKL